MEQPKKKGKFKTGCLGIIVIIIIIIIIAIASGGGSSTTANASPNNSTNSGSNSSNSGSNSSQSSVYKLGESAQLGNYKITFNKFNNSQQIESNGMTMDSTKNNYFIINTTVENTSNKPINSLALSNNIIILKANGKTYSVNDNTSLDASNSNNNTFYDAFTCGGTINPGTPYTTPIVFNTPKAINHGKLLVTLNGNTAVYKF